MCIVIHCMHVHYLHQGFHRYSTDKYWHVPHFEKMLYDQGQLTAIYATAYKVTERRRMSSSSRKSHTLNYLHACEFLTAQITKDEFFAEVIRDILLYVTRDLSDKVYNLYIDKDSLSIS